MPQPLCLGRERSRGGSNASVPLNTRRSVPVDDAQFNDAAKTLAPARSD
jgi:hypothetical protein